MMVMGDSTGGAGYYGGAGSTGTTSLDPYHHHQWQFAAGLHAGYPRWQQQQQQQYDQQQIQQQQQQQLFQPTTQSVANYYGSSASPFGGGFPVLSNDNDVMSSRISAPTSSATGTHLTSPTACPFPRSSSNGGELSRDAVSTFCGTGRSDLPPPPRPDFLRPADFTPLAPLVFCPSTGPPMFDFSSSIQTGSSAGQSSQQRLQQLHPGREFYAETGSAASASLRNRMTSPRAEFQARSRDRDDVKPSMFSGSQTQTTSSVSAASSWSLPPTVDPTALPLPSGSSSSVPCALPSRHHAVASTSRRLSGDDADKPPRTARCSSKATSAASVTRHHHRRNEKKPIPEELKDERYFDRRKKNNEAARRSRESRKRNVDELERTAGLLRQQNEYYRIHIEMLRAEVHKYQELMMGPPLDVQTLQDTLARFRSQLEQQRKQQQIPSTDEIQRTSSAASVSVVAAASPDADEF